VSSATVLTCHRASASSFESWRMARPPCGPAASIDRRLARPDKWTTTNKLSACRVRRRRVRHPERVAQVTKDRRRNSPRSRSDTACVNWMRTLASSPCCLCHTRPSWWYTLARAADQAAQAEYVELSSASWVHAHRVERVQMGEHKASKPTVAVLLHVGEEPKCGDVGDSLDLLQVNKRMTFRSSWCRWFSPTRTTSQTRCRRP
jgi:hypothetical protein